MTKKITFVLALLTCFLSFQSSAQQTAAASATTAVNTLTKEERQYAVTLLTETEAGVYASIKGLNAAQLTFKPAPDKWSVEECIKHIAASEKTLWAMVEDALKQPANPDKRNEVKVSDTALVRMVEDRSHKSKTFAMLEPANSPYKTVEEALAAFKENRAKLIAFIQNTQEDLRNHVMILPLGTFDAYQFILLIAAHSNRHTQQIAEVKGNVSFPK